MKGDKRQQAMKIKKRQKRIIAAVFAITLVAVAAVFLINHMQQRENRVFVLGRTAVTLSTDGTFNAILPHGIVRSGTFSETTSGGVTAVAFVENNRTVTGIINGEVLTIPPEWDDGCEHGVDFSLRR